MKHHDPIDAIESDAAFRVLFKYATIGILVIDNDGRILLMNPNACEIFGYKEGELTGHRLESLLPDHLREKHSQHRHQYFLDPKARPMGKGIDLFAKKKTGAVFPVEISLGYYELEGKSLAVAFITDISERKKTEQQLKKINAELETRVIERTIELSAALEREKELNEMKSRFVSMASHEFRTPLSAVLSSVSLLEKYKGPGEELKRNKHIERIKSSVRNMTDILNDFLSLDKLEQGKVEVNPQRFSLTEFIDDITEELMGTLKSGQKIVHSHNGGPEIHQDRNLFRHILINLLSNASKYSAENSEILISTLIDEESVLLKVQDHGIGIPEDEQDKLFGKFHRASNALDIPGTGLGLNIVKRYVELAGGKISFNSQTGKGTEFTISFNPT